MGEVVVVGMGVGWCYPLNTDLSTQIALRFHFHEISIVRLDLFNGEVFTPTNILYRIYCLVSSEVK